MAHRRVKDISYDDEFDDEDDEYDTGEDYAGDSQGLTPEDEESIRAGAVAIRSELGEAGDAIDEKEIRDALWYYYFDVEKSVEYLRRQHAPRETPKKEKQKPLSKFEQAAAAAAAKLNAGAPRFDVSVATPIRKYQCPNYPTTSTFFADTPFLAVPPSRLGLLVPGVEHSHPKGSLLGGSSTGGGKPSKLAALAASRKRAADEKKKAVPTSVSSSGTTANEQKESGPSGSIALLDKLGRGKSPSEPGAQANGIALFKDTRQVQALERPKPRSYPARAQVAEEGDSEMLDASEEEVTLEEPGKPEPKPDELLAPPSEFAQALFAARGLSNPEHERQAGYQESSQSNANMFTLPYPAATEKDTKDRKGNPTNFDPFSGPSPDDVVSQAQSKGAKTNNKSSTKNLTADASKEQKSTASATADGVAAMKLDEIVQTPSKVKSKNLDVVAEFQKSNLKNAANFVVIGHVDHGKSTLMGRLLHDLSLIPSRSFQKIQTSSQQAGKSSFSFAWLLDTTESERSRGITVDIASTTFSTSKTNFTILDAPGHKDFVPNMIAGTSQADFAVLVVDASTDAFEKGMGGGGQTKEHALLARALGISRIVIAVNKMDSTTPTWSQERFNAVSQQMSAFLASAGFVTKNTALIPCAGLTGQNVVKPLPSQEKDGVSVPWFWYAGPTLLEQLDSTATDISEIAKQHITSPLRLTISDIFRASITSPLSISGRIDAGSMQVGDVVLAMPAGETATIKGLEVESSTSVDSRNDAGGNEADDINTSRGWAIAGQIVTAHLTDIDPVHLRLGDVICSLTQPIRNVRSFSAKILAFDFVVPGAVDCHRGRLHAEAKIASLLAVLDKSGNADAAKKSKRPRVVKPGALAKVKVDLIKSLPLEAGGRVVLRSEGSTVAAGLVEDVEVV